VSGLFDLKGKRVPAEVLKRVPSRVALHYHIIPVEADGDRIAVCAPEGFDPRLKDELRTVLNGQVELYPARREAIAEAIRNHYGVAEEIVARLLTGALSVLPDGGSAEDLAAEKDPTVTALVNELILDALERRATDIHLEPFDDRFSVRYRVDGLLREAGISARLRALSPGIIARIKIMANLDIGEKRLPQDGRIKVRTGKRELDLRVSVLPGSSGETVVVRILGSAELLSLDALGLSPETVTVIRRSLKRPHGLILLTGPTGSGKTTTLYSILKEMNTTERKIITVEDPVEYKMSGIVQIQVKPRIDLTFAAALRSMLRHDPDVLMVGEIRDQETAEIAIRSALTGHLVFSTLHTNDAASALARLMEMGIPPYLIASSVELVIGQRLVRTVCTACRGRGGECDDCRGSGFRGREAIEEVLRVDEEVRRLILASAPADAVREHMRRTGERFLRDRGREKVRAGRTTAGEIERVC